MALAEAVTSSGGEQSSEPSTLGETNRWGAMLVTAPHLQGMLRAVFPYLPRGESVTQMKQWPLELQALKPRGEGTVT